VNIADETHGDDVQDVVVGQFPPDDLARNNLQPMHAVASSFARLEMIMGMGFPFPLEIPQESHENGMGIDDTLEMGRNRNHPVYGNGNGPYSNGNKSPSADAVFSLCNSNVQFII